VENRGIAKADQPMRGIVPRMKRFGRWLFNALAAASVIVLLFLALDIWQTMGMNPSPGNPFTPEIGLWRGGNGWVPIWVIICAALPAPIAWIVKKIS
jgi:hypothetical protein